VLLAKEIYESGSYFPKDWTFVNGDIWIFSAHTIIIPLLRFFPAGYSVFAFSSVVMTAAILLSVIALLAILKVENHKAVLPCDYESVTQATGLTKGGVQFAMRGANNTFHPLFFSSANNLPFIDGVNPIGTDENGNPIFNFMNYDAAISKQLIAELPYTFKDVTYKINDNYIITTFKEGASVLMAYKAFPVDEDGYPLIPDNEKFKQAVQWYIMHKLAFRTWIKGALKYSYITHLNLYT
jgi:hypothetical protein